MNVDQTANWVWTFSNFNGWKEGETYSLSFRENVITGQMLQQITLELMEFDLGITNPGHRDEILKEIQLLFPRATVGNVVSGLCSSLIEIHTPRESAHSGGLLVMGSTCGSSRETIQSSVDAMSESYASTSSNMCSFKTRKLLLTIPPDHAILPQET